MIDTSAAAFPDRQPAALEQAGFGAANLRLFLLTWAGGLLFFLTYLG